MEGIFQCKKNLQNVVLDIGCEMPKEEKN